MKVYRVNGRYQFVFKDGRSGLVESNDAWELLDNLRRVLADETREKMAAPPSGTGEKT